MNDHLKKFAQMVAEETSRIGTPIDTETKDTEISVADYVANYLSNGPIKEERKDPIDTSVQTKHNSLVATINDTTPAAPKDIEAQRWNDPLKPLDQKFVTFQDMNDHYSKFLGRIQTQMSTMSGGGEVNLRNLDDVDRSSIGPNKYFSYNPITRKFFFESEVQSDWNEANVETPTFIKNKPPISYDIANNDIIIESGNSLVVSDEIRKDSGNLSILTDNYLILDSTNNGQIEIGRNSGLGNVVIGNKANGTDISIFGDVLFSGSDYKADFAGSDIENVNVIKTIQTIEFDVTHDTSTHNHSVGTVCWDEADQTINIFHPNGVTQQVGQEQYAYVINNTGSTITNGTVVRFDGAAIPNGEARLEVAPLIANGLFPSLYTVGVSTQDIQDGESGKITVFGKVRDIDTTGTSVGEVWEVGDILYANSSVAGNFTKNKPTAPYNVIPMAAILRVDSEVGEIFVRPTIDQQKSYGRFTRNTTQTATTINTPTEVIFNTTEISNGVLLGSPSSKIQVNQSGFYQFDLSVQGNSPSNKGRLYLWFRKNGVDVPYSMRTSTITNGDVVVVSFAIQISLVETDYVEIMWATTHLSITLNQLSETTFGPDTAAVLLSVSQSEL